MVERAMASVGSIQVRAGRLHIPGEVYDAWLSGCPAVALLAREGQWLLLPLLAGAGGLQIKLRNLRGDRVVEAQEFLRAQGLGDDHAAQEFELVRVEEHGGFVMQAKVD